MYIHTYIHTYILISKCMQSYQYSIHESVSAYHKRPHILNYYIWDEKNKSDGCLLREDPLIIPSLVWSHPGLRYGRGSEKVIHRSGGPLLKSVPKVAVKHGTRIMLNLIVG